MEYKYTKSGKKVAVVGQLNANQWIVREIFMSGDGEIPCGENFIEASLLDEPVVTWEEKRKNVLEAKIKRLESEISDAEGKLKVVRQHVNSVTCYNNVIAKYGNIDCEELKTFLSFISGEITHVVVDRYNPEIFELKDIIGECEDSRFSGLKLINLFGTMSDGKRKTGEDGLSLEWRINMYSDGSGSWDTIIPCVSFEEAKEECKRLNKALADRRKNENLSA